MNLKLFNSLNKTTVDLDLKNKDNFIKIYVCGMTVYDYCHIGHGRLLIVFDVLHRFLKYIHPNTIFVQNITDFGEKIKQKAKELNFTETELTEHYIEALERDSSNLNILKPDLQPKASDYISKIIEYIQLMLIKNFAYLTSSGIYFDTSKVEYGCFENRECQEEGSFLKDKRSKKDFVLWKFGESYNFESPWGRGMPGWHIECTTMSHEILGEFFNIHGGGLDLQFPHHENEIAQSKAIFNHGPADIWMHNGMININGNKMSKSLKNMKYLKDFKNSFELDSLRLLILSHNYHHDLDIFEEKFEQYKKMLQNIRKYYFKNCLNLDKQIEKNFSCLSDLYNDLDTCSLINKLGNLMNQNLKSEVKLILEILGLKMENLCKLSLEEINEQIKQRSEAKINKNWSLADSIKGHLKENFIEIQDKTNNETDFYLI